MKKIVIVTAVLTTTLVYDSFADDAAKPESMDTVVDIVAVGKKTDAKSWELSKKKVKAISNLVLSDLQLDTRPQNDIFSKAIKEQKKAAKKTTKTEFATKRAQELIAANKSWFKPRAKIA